MYSLFLTISYFCCILNSFFVFSWCYIYMYMIQISFVMKLCKYICIYTNTLMYTYRYLWYISVSICMYTCISRKWIILLSKYLLPFSIRFFSTSLFLKEDNILNTTHIRLVYHTWLGRWNEIYVTYATSKQNLWEPVLGSTIVLFSLPRNWLIRW